MSKIQVGARWAGPPLHYLLPGTFKGLPQALCKRPVQCMVQTKTPLQCSTSFYSQRRTGKWMTSFL